MRKLKVLFHSNDIKALTGLGKNAKSLLMYLARTGKYDLYQFSAGTIKNNPSFKNRAWPTFGTLPDNDQLRGRILSNAKYKNHGSYGAYTIDELIEEIKPDVYIGSEDIWAFSDYVDRTWWKHLQTIVHTTLDSIPVHSDAHIYAENSTKFLIWSEFAKKELHLLGHKNSGVMPGILETNNFYRLDKEQRAQLRKNTGLHNEDFVIGFVFRNQLRKSVPNLLEAFKQFQKTSSQNSYLLLHTTWSDTKSGWDIVKLIDEFEINPRFVLATYYCKECGAYLIAQYIGEGCNCKVCKTKESLNTVDSINGVSDIQLNEVYNLMDVYCHPFTSGGQEIPIQEAKLVELPTLVTDYSCGVCYSQPNVGSLPLSWEPYRIPDHNQFVKATTSYQSINRQLKKVYGMSPEKRQQLGKRGREFVIENFSVEKIGPKWEQLLDTMKPIENWNISFEPQFPNPDYQPSDDLKNDDWVVDIHKGYLNMSMSKLHPDLKHWVNMLENGQSREKLKQHFKQLAIQIGNQKKQEYEETHIVKSLDLSPVLGDESYKERICVVLPESIGDIIMATSLLEDLKKKYNKKIYFATKPQYFYLLDGNPFIHKVIPYVPEMDDLRWLEGVGDNTPYFYVAFALHFGTQILMDYAHNGNDIVD